MKSTLRFVTLKVALSVTSVGAGFGGPAVSDGKLLIRGQNELKVLQVTQ